MKKIFILILTLNLIMSSCSSNVDILTLPDVDTLTQSENSEFAMTAKLNGITFQANNPFGNNKFSSTNIWDYFPTQDFVMLQGRQGGIFGTPEINIWLKKSDIIVGSYQISQDTFETPSSHFISIIDLSNNVNEYTKKGVIVITDIDTSAKIIKGTFEFTTTDDPNLPSAPITINITEGKFNYQYE